MDTDYFERAAESAHEKEDEQPSLNLIDLELGSKATESFKQKELPQQTEKFSVYDRIARNYANDLSDVYNNMDKSGHVWSEPRGAEAIKNMTAAMSKIYQTEGSAGLQRFVDQFNKGLPKDSPMRLSLRETEKDVSVNLSQGCKCAGCTMQIAKK